MATDTVHHIVKDAFHEMVAGIQKQPSTPFYPSVKKPKGSVTASQKRARKIAEQAASQSAGGGSMSYSPSAGKKKKRVEGEVARQTAGTAPRKKGTTTATTAAGRSLQRVEDKKKDFQDPDFRAKVQRDARRRKVAYETAKQELLAYAKDPERMRNLASQIRSAQAGEGRKQSEFAFDNPSLVKPYSKPTKKIGGFGGKDRFSRYLAGLVGKKMQKAIRSWAEGVLANG